MRKVVSSRHSPLATELDWITLKAMEKDPDRRYASALALAEDIRRHLNHEPITAASPSPIYRLSKYLRRNRMRVTVTGAAILVLACMIALSITSSRASRQTQLAKALRDRETLQSAQEAFSDRRLPESLDLVVPILDSESIGTKAQLLQANILFEGGHPQETETILTSLVKEAPEIAGAAHALLARMYWEGANDQTDALKQAAHHRQAAERLLPETAEASYLRALTALTIRETLQMLEEALFLDPRHYQSRRLHAYTLSACGRYLEMETDAQMLIVARPGDSLGYFLSATARFEQDKHEQALRDIERALTLAPLEDDRHKALLDLQCRCLLALGRHQATIAHADAALQAFPKEGILAFHKFAALLALGGYDQATELFYEFGLVDGRPKRDFLWWGIEYVFDTQAAGQGWHHPEKRPVGLPFIHLHEAADNYRALTGKARRLISKGFSPQWSPDGGKLAYSRGVVGVSGVAIYDVQTQQSELLIAPGKDPRWSPDGQHLVFVRGRRVLDVARLSSVERRRLPPDRKNEKIWIMRSDGSEARRLALGGWPSWSADGKHIFYHSRVESSVYEIAAFDRSARPRYVHAISQHWPSVSPDGQQLAWIRGDKRLCIRNMDSPSMGLTHVHDFPDSLIWGGLWSPDGRFFGFGAYGPIIRAGLWLYDVQQACARKVLSGKALSPHWSSDGRTLAFCLDQPFFEIWTADVASLGPGQTLPEHDREMIIHYTRRIACDFGSTIDSGINLNALRAQDVTSLSVSKAVLYLLRADCYVRLNELDKAIADIEQAAHISGEGEKTARWLDRLKAAHKAGSCVTKGSMTYDGVTETYSVVGAGLDIWDDTDEFHYAHATLEGDGSISAKIESVEHVHNWTKVGLMIRDTLDSASAHGHICITPLGLVTFQWREREGGATRDASTGTLRVRLPHWVRLTRQGNRFTPEHSSDGTQWEPITGPQDANGLSPIEIPMNESVHIGLAITSSNITRTAEARISNVKITGTITPTGPLATSEDIRLKVPKSREE